MRSAQGAASRVKEWLVAGGVAAWLVLLASCTQTGPAASASHDASPAPEAATGWRATMAEARVHPHWAVVTANPLASEAAASVLRQGGNAVDAAVAAQMMLALVEPQSSGLGGGAFLMHWDGQVIDAWDGREVAPARANEKLFLQPDGRPMQFLEAVNGGRSVGVPGAVRMLEAVHRAHGRLPWARLFEPAIAQAEEGFVLSPRLAGLLNSSAGDALRRDPQARPYFFHADDGNAQPRALAAGERLRNPALAEVLRRIAAGGSAALNEGPVADDIVRRVTTHAGNPGMISKGDLAGYEPRQRTAMCTRWRVWYEVCGFPPPSSGHITVMQILGMLDSLPDWPAPLEDGAPSPGFLHRYAEAARLAYADRARYVGDPAFTTAPDGGWSSLLDSAYLSNRAALISDSHSMGIAEPGHPGGGDGVSYSSQADQPEYGTTHLAIVDADGHAVSMTTTVEAAFGSRIMSDGGTGLPGGFLLNNELTDFSFVPRGADGRPVANRVQPGKRPRSSMGPTLVFDSHSGARRLVLLLGSAGGASIIHYNAKALLAVLAWGLTPQQALDLPNFANDNGVTRLERGRFPGATETALRARGQSVVDEDMASGSQALMRVEGGWLGGTDRRREGVVAGD